MNNDSELFQLFLQGSEEAFNAIYEKYALQLLDEAYKRLQSKETAKEAVQEVFINLFLKRREIRYTQNLGGYLFTALRNKTLDIIRRDLLHATHHRMLAKQQSSYFSIEDKLWHKELETRLQRSIQSLPDRCREVFLLNRYEGLSYKSIAQKLHISVNTVEKHIVKALRILRSQIAENDKLLLLLPTIEIGYIGMVITSEFVWTQIIR